MTERQLDRWLDDGGSDLDLWTTWNNCKAWHQGQQAIATPEGQQFLLLTPGVVMLSEPAGQIGWHVQIMTEVVFRETYLEVSDTTKWKLVTPRMLE